MILTGVGTACAWLLGGRCCRRTDLRFIASGFETEGFPAGVIHCEERLERVILIVSHRRARFQDPEAIHIIELLWIAQARIGQHAEHEHRARPGFLEGKLHGSLHSGVDAYPGHVRVGVAHAAIEDQGLIPIGVDWRIRLFTGKAAGVMVFVLEDLNRDGIPIGRIGWMRPDEIVSEAIVVTVQLDAIVDVHRVVWVAADQLH